MLTNLTHYTLVLESKQMFKMFFFGTNTRTATETFLPLTDDAI